VKHLYGKLVAQSAEHPADFVISEAGMSSVGRTLLGESGRAAQGLAVLELAVERSPGSYQAREALAAGCEKLGDMERARKEYREALRLSPQLAKLSAKKLEESPQ